jgi:hypothetical protein
MIARGVAALALLFGLGAALPVQAGALPPPHRRACGRIEKTPIVAFNLSCRRARRIWHQASSGTVPRGWTGGNLDSGDGGEALFYPLKAAQHVQECIGANGLRPAKLGPRTPVVFARVPYGK